MEPMTFVYAVSCLVGVALAFYLFRKRLNASAFFIAALSGMNGAKALDLNHVVYFFALVILAQLGYAVYKDFLAR